MPKIPTLLLYLFIMQQLKGCDTVLDLGCGASSPIRFVKAKTFGIDADDRVIEKAKKKRTHDNLVVLDVKKIGTTFAAKSFDAVVALDFIEHLNKKDGYRLTNEMEKIARKKVLIFTPNGFMIQAGPSEFDRHLSGWTVEEFRNLDYKIYGMYGPKFLRGDYHGIRFGPIIFWSLISEFLQWSYIVYNPKKSAALLCVKNL